MKQDDYARPSAAFGVGIPLVLPGGVAAPVPMPGLHNGTCSPYMLVPASALQFLPGYRPMLPEPSAPAPATAPHAPLYQAGYHINYGCMPAPRPPPRHVQHGGCNAHGMQSHPQSAVSMSSCSERSLESPASLAEHMDTLDLSMHQRRHKHSGKGGRSTSATHRSVSEPLEASRARTVYASDIGKDVTEAKLARWFSQAGDVVECRICSDMNACKCFAFVEFRDAAGFEAALSMSGQKLGASTVKISPSRTAIVPVSRDYMPRNADDLARCERTVYINQIDRQVPASMVQAIFSQFCGPISRFKMKMDKQTGTRIAFVEFETTQAARLALGMCGTHLGSTQLRVSPSKTPVRP